jgi:hypothetical protein
VTACEHVRRELGGYVLGGLEPQEAVAVREHLASCGECSAEHARLAGLPALLSLAERVESAPPLSPVVEERVLDAVARERPRPPRRRALGVPRWAWAGAAAAVAAVAVAVVLALSAGGEPAGGGYEVALRPVPGSHASGHAELETTDEGTALRMWVRDLPADPGVVYEVHCDAPDWSASAGTFRVGADGRAYVVLTTAARRGEYDSIRVVRRDRDSAVLTASLD